MIRYIKKLLYVMADMKAKRALLSNSNIDIHLESKISSWKKVRPTSGSFITIGKGSIVDGALITELSGARITIGENSFIGNSKLISAREIEIGNDVMVAWDTVIYDHNSHSVKCSERKNDVRDWFYGRKNWQSVEVGKITIKNKAWIGFNVIILKGVTIGEGAIVAAGSVVSKSVPDWTIVGGNPARIIRELDENER